VEELRDWYGFSEEARRAREAPSTTPKAFDEEFAEDFAALGSLEPDHEPGYGTVRKEAVRVGRNDPCPCGSGKKHKKCCGKA